MGYRLPPADDGVVLTAVFDIVEQIGEVASSISSGDIWHFIRLSDFRPDVNLRPSNIDQAKRAMLAIAAGEVDETWTATWLEEPVRFVDLI